MAKVRFEPDYLLIGTGLFVFADFVLLLLLLRIKKNIKHVNESRHITTR